MPSPPDSPRTSPRLVGRAVERVEDAALLTARGRFADDMGERPGTAHAAVLRSPHAHAEIVSLDTTAALSMPAVVTVLTGEDVAAWSRPFIAGVKQPMRHFALAVDRVRYAGEPVAVVVARDADAGGGESGLAPRHGRLERSKTGPYLSTRAAGSAASSNRRLQYFAGSADRWVVLPILRPPTVGPGTRRRSDARRGPAPGAPSGHDTWCVVPCDGSPRPALPRASPEPRACGSRTCPVRQAPREYVAPRTSHGCAGESRVHARSAPRQSALVANALGCATRSTRSGRHRALEPWWRFGIRPGALS